MATSTSHQDWSAGTESERQSGSGRQEMRARLTSERVWQALGKASFAVISHLTPAGEIRSSGVVYKVIRRRLYVAVAPDSWKARHIAVSNQVAVTVPVRRGGIFSLVAPIPPATVSFRGTAIVHRGESAEARALVAELGSFVPPQRRSSAAVIEIIPHGEFLTYALDVPLRKMLDPAVAQARVAVSDEGHER